MSLVKCSWCDGKGIDDFKLNSPCEVCGGDGYIDVPDPPTKCGRCNGTGKTKDSFSQQTGKCSGCKGTGWAT